MTDQLSAEHFRDWVEEDRIIKARIHAKLTTLANAMWDKQQTLIPILRGKRQ